MRLVCPSCAAAYDVPDGKLSAGRVVRCARCDEEWTPVAARSVPLPAAATLPEPASEPASEPALSAAPASVARSAPAPSRAAPRRAAATKAGRPGSRRVGRLFLPAAWAASVLLLAGLAWGGYAWRAQIMAGWPPSERLYATLGLGPSR